MMFFEIIKNLFKPYLRSRLRKMMRGYRILRVSGQLNRIALLKEELTETKLALGSRDFSSVIMGSAKPCGEIIIRQYLLIRVGGSSLNAALLRALGEKNGKVVFPLPKQWQKIIQQHGFKVDTLRSDTLWFFYIFGALVYGIFATLKVICSGLNSIRLKPFNIKKYVYFSTLTLGNLPPQNKKLKNYDVISWYLQWEGKAKGIDVISHSVPNTPKQNLGGVDLESQVDLIPRLGSLASFLKYFFWSFSAVFLASLDCARGRWWHAFILNQAALSAQVRSLNKKTLALDYMFHNSGPIYRPLWTYDAENYGSRIIFYFYSTNSENFKTSEAEATIPYGWKAMSWPYFLVWDEWQRDFVKKSIKYDAKIDVVGPIWFGSALIQCSIKNEKLIAVFDVQPMRDSIYQILGIPYEYYVASIANTFVSDIYVVALNRGLTIALKRKRNIGNRVHPIYMKKINKLILQPNFCEIDVDLSPWELIEKSKLVISMPFTSTALIARDLGKPSVYYDPTGHLKDNDPAAHGIEVISSKDSLNEWIERHRFKM